MASISILNLTLPVTSLTANSTYFLNAGDSNGLSNPASGSLFDVAGAAGVTFQIDGNLFSAAGILDYGNLNTASAALKFIVGDTGSLQSDSDGLRIAGSGSSVENHGFIMGGGTRAVYMVGNGMSVVNTGSIIGSGTGTDGVQFFGNNFTMTNSGTIRGESGIVGNNTTAGSVSKITNSGHILDDGGFAIVTGNGEETVINSGQIHGSVNLGGGNDTFIDNKGRVDVYVAGGAGNDTFIIKGVNTEINDSSGSDTVKVNRSWTLGSDFEVGILIGKADATLTGHSGASTLTGNVGDNRIIGGAGADQITGGKGNDRMTGSDGINLLDFGDNFIFRAGSGKDIITDFQDGVDKITLTDYSGIDAYGDLKGQIHQKGNDVVIELSGNDTITLLNFDRNDLSAADFVF